MIHNEDVIIVKNIAKYFGQTPVLRDFSFTLESGQSLALLGLSGSGKTTALKLIAGLHAPSQGEISVGGIPLVDANLPQIRKKIGYVIQDGGLFPHLTARENISLVGKEAGLTVIQIDEHTRQLAAMTKLAEDLLDRYPRELSGGQRQRVGIIRALLLDPEILLLDEPMGALDPITRRELQVELQQLFQRLKKTVILVTHDLFEATYLADSIILLENGRIVQRGTMRELIDTPASDFVRAFVQAQNNHLEAP